MNIEMNKEVKPTSFRITEEVKERFKEITKENNWNQDQALNKLISIYEIEQAKVTISGRTTEIETFEMHLQALSEKYRMSLQLNQEMEKNNLEYKELLKELDQLRKDNLNLQKELLEKPKTTTRKKTAVAKKED